MTFALRAFSLPKRPVIARAGHTHVDLRLGSVDQLHRFQRSFDRVMAVNVTPFWSTPDVSLAVVRQVMRPGGSLALTVQPRGRTATRATSHRAANALVDAATRAGFTALRVALLPLRPVPAVCVLATA